MIIYKKNMIEVKKFSDVAGTNALFQRMAKQFRSDEVALVKNPEYIYTLFDAYILAPKITKPLQALLGIVCDMDGTTTTTETLCLYSQEWMMRKATGREDPKVWTGLDHEKDYPHIIGNSTTKHIEYLINAYSAELKEEPMKKAYIECSLWTILIGRDNGRRKEALESFKVFGLDAVQDEAAFKTLAKKKIKTEKHIDALSEKIYAKYKKKFRIEEFHDVVRAAIEIYYFQYHSILVKLEEGKGKNLALQLFHDEDKRMIEPMPGVGVYLAMIKGWFGAECGAMYDDLKKHLEIHGGSAYKNSKHLTKKEFEELGAYFEKNPVQISIVTSSIYYEANIVLGEVFKVLSEQIRVWKIPKAKKSFLLKKFSNYRNIYDSFITASDSSETRLKPHRDLYSIALHKMGFTPKDFDKIIGYEDSESGTIAIRAAGIGKCVAVPFLDTAGHNLTAAAHVLKAGLVEALLGLNGFIDKKSI